MSPVRPEHIPDHVKDSVARNTVYAIRRFYDDPENARKFEEWKAKKEKEGGLL